jgi:hypothetical protein
MPVIAIPKDIEFRKVTPAQQKGLDKLLQESKTNVLRAVAIPTIALSTLAVVGATAYLFRDQIKEFIEENVDNLGEAIVEKVKGGAEGAGEIVADVITNVIGRDNPQTPEFTPSGAGPIPRCQRWASDYVDTIVDDPSPGQVPLLALAQLNIIKNMKAEKCDRPSVIKQAQWDSV